MGFIRLSSRRCEAAKSGRRDTSPAASSRTATRWCFAKIERKSPGAMVQSRRRWKSRFQQETDAEVRRVSITNLGSRPREIELTSYAEMVLAAARRMTPPIRLSPNCSCKRNSSPTSERSSPRGGCARPTEPQVWAAHLVVVEGETVGDLQFETDRARFLGRGRGIRTPISVIDGQALSNTAGTVLDPIFSLRSRVRIAPGATARLAFWTLVAAVARRSARPGRQAPRPGSLRPRGHAGVDPGAGSALSSGRRRRRKRICFSVWPITCFTPTRRCVLRRTCCDAACIRSRCSGASESRATCRSFRCASMRPKTWRSSGNCFAPTNTGG